MEDEKSILDATEYILMALNNVKNYNEYMEYKEEIEKAVYDIRNSITNIMNKKDNNKSNINNINKSDTNKSSISSMLGLKFNYDAYLKDFNINNYNQNNFDNKNINYNFKNQNNIYDNNENNEEENKINNENININKKNDFGLQSFKDENIDFDPKQNKEDNIIYNKSIRNKIKISNNNANNNKNENDNNKDNNKIIQQKEKPIDINEKLIPNINHNKNKSQPLLYKKDKLSLIADIIMKINSEDYFYEILTQLFGNDLTDKLMSSDVSDELLEAVQNSIKEIEELKKKDNLNSEQNQKKEEINQEEIEEEPRQFPVNEIMGPNIKGKNNKKINEEENNVYQEFDFKKNLRKNENLDVGRIKSKNYNNNINKKGKPFISATSAYGNYFDPPLQKGGISKLDDFKK